MATAEQGAPLTSGTGTGAPSSAGAQSVRSATTA